ncbi:MAG TPA: MFS transporter [Candidatus Baltobacteraceae bacterium]
MIVSRTFSSLGKHRNYRLYFYGQLVSQIGTWLQNAAQAWLILDLTHSAWAVGVLAFFLYGPYALLGLVGSAMADRFDRRKTLIVTQAAMALCAVVLAAVAFAHVDSVWVIDAIAAVRGTILVFNNPSRQAFIVQLVGRAELQNAIALNSSVNNSTRIVGPAVAGLLIAGVGVAWCFALNAVSFVAVIVALCAMRESELHPSGALRTDQTLLASIGTGLQYARHTKAVAIVLSMMFVIATFGINFSVLLPVLARQTLQGDAKIFGLVTASFGLGALCGALVTASRVRASRGLLLLAAVGFGAAQLLVALAGRNLWFTVVALLLTGVCYTIYTASTNAIVQLATPGFLQGRTGRTLQLRFYGQRSVGRLAGGRARRTEYEPGLRRRRRIRAGHGRRRIRAAAVADAHRYGHRASKRAISSSSAALNA